MIPTQMHHQEFAPPEALRNTINCFWYTRLDSGERQASFEVQPDGYAEIIFYFGSLYNVSYHDGLQQLPSPFLMGLLNQPVVFQTQDLLEVIGIRCYPWTVFDLLGLPSDNEGMRIFEHPVARLQPVLNELIHVGKLAEAVAEITQYFMGARTPIVTDTVLSKAGTAMSEANGTLPVSEVAAAAHATVRTLERKFKQSSGHSVKDVSGLMRFEQVRNQLWTDPDTKLAGLAHELGYTDQSHLSREFKRYSGTTPAAFARKAKNGKLAARDDFVVLVQS